MQHLARSKLGSYAIYDISQNMRTCFVSLRILKHQKLIIPLNSTNLSGYHVTKGAIIIFSAPNITMKLIQNKFPELFI